MIMMHFKSANINSDTQYVLLFFRSPVLKISRIEEAFICAGSTAALRIYETPTITSCILITKKNMHM